ncbi:hypothetical protein NDU88_000313 [Pleurodeles waltl]|uniref:Uncharacterized protein n=1 Tax=Pleurodeles waltl TaxID=8319 RepID=A0AAV7S993_PLEWA|nr:hypothetical protein NDU88_000313 [Pleurodeles waltl]
MSARQMARNSEKDGSRRGKRHVSTNNAARTGRGRGLGAAQDKGGKKEPPTPSVRSCFLLSVRLTPESSEQAAAAEDVSGRPACHQKGISLTEPLIFTRCSHAIRQQI